MYARHCAALDARRGNICEAADMADDPDSSAQLTPFERVSSAVAGIALGVTGCIATFTTDNEFGTGALIVLGGAFGVLALTGQPIRRIKIGDHETEFYAKVGRKAVEVAESDSGDVSERETALELVEQVRETTPNAPTRVVSLSLAYQYERTVLDAVQRAAAVVETPKFGPVDAIVDKTIGVEVKYRSAGRAPGKNALSPGGAYRQAVERAAASGLDALLVVTNSTVAFDQIESVPDTQSGRPLRVKLLQWTQGMGDEVLKAGLSEMVSDI